MKGFEKGNCNSRYVRVVNVQYLQINEVAGTCEGVKSGSESDIWTVRATGVNVNRTYAVSKLDDLKYLTLHWGFLLLVIIFESPYLNVE